MNRLQAELNLPVGAELGKPRPQGPGSMRGTDLDPDVQLGGSWLPEDTAWVWCGREWSRWPEVSEVQGPMRPQLM